MNMTYLTMPYAGNMKRMTFVLLLTMALNAPAHADPVKACDVVTSNAQTPPVIVCPSAVIAAKGPYDHCPECL